MGGSAAARGDRVTGALSTSLLAILPDAFRIETDAAGTSNVAAEGVPFQRWYNFKEAFAPTFVAEMLESVPFRVRTCLDPFGGCGTTALTCQLLGVHPTSIEVNPFLADLTESKLARYDRHQLLVDRIALADRCVVAGLLDEVEDLFPGAPATFVEPGEKDRWIFDAAVAQRIQQYRQAIEAVEDETNRRLFRVLLGSVLISVSNVTISGKGRRYRSKWQAQSRSAQEVDRRFDRAFLLAYRDICSFSERRTMSYRLLRGDARERIVEADPVDLVLFSPPYPNSFDYTDIYNVELWALGYLTGAADNRQLRESTLRSHVQIKREFADGDLGSPTLGRTLDQLEEVREALWNPHIPAMISAYFKDLMTVVLAAKERLTDQGQIVMVVGDSRYAGVKVDVPAVVQELVTAVGLACIEVRAVRSMRSSPQDGGRMDLTESLVRLVPT